MNQLQSKLLEMLTWLSKYLEEHNIRYYVVAGTFLGTVRHEGFIPWDDDVDIAVPRADYQRLLELLKEPVDHYVIESPYGGAPDFIYNFAKFYDTNTTMTEIARKNVTRGVYIDVFPLDGIGDTSEESYRNYKKIDICNMLLTMKISTYRKGRKWWKNVAVACGALLPFNAGKMALKLDKLSAERDYDKCNYVGVLATNARKNEIMPREYYGKPTPYKFENITVYGPEKAEEYLTRLFGDWRQLPPENERGGGHFFTDIDMNRSYLK